MIRTAWEDLGAAISTDHASVFRPKLGLSAAESPIPGSVRVPKGGGERSCFSSDSATTLVLDPSRRAPRRLNHRAKATRRRSQKECHQLGHLSGCHRKSPIWKTRVLVETHRHKTT